jgi:hypothetical protein
VSYFSVAGSIQDLGGQGGHWYIDHGAAAIADGDLPGGATQPFNRSLLVNQGETVLFTYEAGPAYRSEASLDLTVTPTANPACSLTSNLVDVYLDANAHGGQTLAIAATLAGCPFSAQTSSPTQLAIAGADPQGRLNGTTGAGGAASLTYNVASNPGQYREMTILVSMGQTTRLFTVHQTGADPCQVTDLNIYYQTVDSGTHNINLVVTTTAANCSFTVARTVGGSWLGLPGGGATYSGTTGANRQATVLLNVAANQGAQRTGTLHFSPTQGQTIIEYNLTQRAYSPPADPCAQGWSSDSYIPDGLTFVGGAGGAVQFRVNPPAGCQYKAIERCGTYCTTNSPRLDNSLPAHTGAYTYNTHVPGLSCGGGNTRTTYVDVKTTSDSQTRNTIVIFQTCASDAPGDPAAADSGKPTPEPAPDPDQWDNGSCLPSREVVTDASSASSASIDTAVAPPTIEEQVDALAESLGKEYRQRREEILTTSGDPKTDLDALEKEIAGRFEQGTIDIYDQSKLPSPFDPGCPLPPPNQAPAKP